MTRTLPTRSALPPHGVHTARCTPWLVALAPVVLLTACASTPPHYPSHTAQTFVGRPLFDLEMRWSTPTGLQQTGGGHVATWQFNQYNYAGCSVTVHTDGEDIIRKVSWTTGCGPKKTPGKHRSAPDR